MQSALDSTTIAVNSRVPPWRLLLMALVVSSGGSFQLGFHLTVTNPSQEVFERFVNASWQLRHRGSNTPSLTRPQLEALWGAVVAVLFVGAIVGSLAIKPVGDRLGRKWGLVLSNLLTLCTLALVVASKFVCLSAHPIIFASLPPLQLLSIELYALARLLLGAVLSLSVGIAATYLTECSPNACRGAVSTITGVLVELGTVAGSVAGMPQLLGTDRHWWLLYAGEAIPIMVALLATTALFPESPSYLLSHRGAGRRSSPHRQRAVAAVAFFMPSGIDSLVLERLLAEREQDAKSTRKASNMFEIWRGTEHAPPEQPAMGAKKRVEWETSSTK